jgi:hypothetical protein
LPTGLTALASLAIPDRGYAARLFRSLFFGQLCAATTADAPWSIMDGKLIDQILGQAGVPCAIIGDSHASHYRRRAWIGTAWFAPLCIQCHGGSAMGLGGDESRSGYGAKILLWAEQSIRDRPAITLFLKFGGIDAEFIWMLRRIQDRIDRFSVAEFESFATRSVAAYGRFLDRLIPLISAGRTLVCAVFPTALTDAFWAGVFVAPNAGSPGAGFPGAGSPRAEPSKHASRLTEALGRIEIPDLRDRTRLRALYNGKLSAMCATKKLTFVDDFSPLIGSGGTLDRRFFAADPADYNADYAATDAVMTAITRRFVHPIPA